MTDPPNSVPVHCRVCKAIGAGARRHCSISTGLLALLVLLIDFKRCGSFSKIQ